MSAANQRVVRGVTVPSFLYGTAWKEERTGPLVAEALRAGFRGIDTANQRRHYHEAGVGEAIRTCLEQGLAARSDLFLQTKFTHRAGQDQRLPYDPAADLGTQVRQSFESSLEHLGTDHVDAYVLHGPSLRTGLAEADWAAWRAMEGLHREGRARLVGVSNVSLEQLAALHAGASVKPAFVQNRTFASTGWDREIRLFCREHDIVYQAFSLLTANTAVLRSPVVLRAAERLARSPAAVVFGFAVEKGMLPLTGTSDPEHMREDLAAPGIGLTAGELNAIERLSG